MSFELFSKAPELAPNYSSVLAIAFTVNTWFTVNAKAQKKSISHVKRAINEKINSIRADESISQQSNDEVVIGRLKKLASIMVGVDKAASVLITTIYYTAKFLMMLFALGAAFFLYLGFINKWSALLLMPCIISVVLYKAICYLGCFLIYVVERFYRNKLRTVQVPPPPPPKVGDILDGIERRVGHR